MSDTVYISTEAIIKQLLDESSSSQSVEQPSFRPTSIVISDSFLDPSIKASDIDEKSLDLSSVKSLRLESCSLRCSYSSTNSSKISGFLRAQSNHAAVEIIDLIKKIPLLESLSICNCSKLDTIDRLQRLTKLDPVPSLRRLVIIECPGRKFNTKQETFQLLKSVLDKIPSLEDLYLDSIGPLTLNQILYLSKRLKRFRLNSPNYLRKGCPVVFDSTEYVNNRYKKERTCGFGYIESCEKYRDTYKVGIKPVDSVYLGDGSRLPAKMPPYIYSYFLGNGLKIDIRRSQLVYIDEESRIPEFIDHDGNLIRGEPFPGTQQSLKLIDKLNKRLEDGEDVEILHLKIEGTMDSVERFCIQSYMPLEDVNVDDDEDLESYDQEDESQRIEDVQHEEEYLRAIRQ